MEENNFRSLMEFLKFLENEDMKGSAAEDAMMKLADSVGHELTEEQRTILAKELAVSKSKGQEAGSASSGDY